MNDTPPELSRRLNEKYLRLTPDERIEMATSMFECAKEIVISSITNENPEISVAELKRELFRRLYGADYSEREQHRIIETF
jgi:hypothetical protein